MECCDSTGGEQMGISSELEKKKEKCKSKTSVSTGDISMIPFSNITSKYRRNSVVSGHCMLANREFQPKQKWGKVGKNCEDML